MVGKTDLFTIATKPLLHLEIKLMKNVKDFQEKTIT